MAEPVSGADWQVHELDDDGGGTSIAVVDGALCIVYIPSSFSTDEPARFARTTATPPTSAGDWAFHALPGEPDAEDPGGGGVIKVVGEQIVIQGSTTHVGFRSGYGVTVSDSLEPSESADWFAQEIATAPGGADSSFLNLGDRVAIIYPSISTVGEADRVLAAVSEDVPLTSSTLWSPKAYELETLAVRSHGIRTAGMAAGRPYAILTDFDFGGDLQTGFLRIARATSVNTFAVPSSLAWESSTIDVGFIAGQLACSAVIEDRILVAYVNGEPGTLMVAVAEGPY